MERIAIKVYVTLASALNANRANYGTASLELSDDDVSGLPEEVKAIVPDYVGSSARSLHVDSPNVSSTVAALHAEAERRATEATAKASAREARIEEALRRPLLDWIDPSDGTVKSVRAMGLEYSDSDHPALQELFKRADVVSKPIRAKFEAERDERFAREQAERQAVYAAKEEAKARALAGAIDWAKGRATLARAAEEEYEVKSAVADFVAADIEETVLDVEGVAVWAVLRERTAEYQAWGGYDERIAPLPYAFHARDAVVEALKAVPIPDGWEVDVSRIAHIIPGDDEKKFTGVVVTLSSPVTDDRVVVLNFEKR